MKEKYDSFGRRILRNFVGFFTTRALSHLLGFLLVVYLARVLQPESFGTYGFLEAYGKLFYLLGTLGITSYGMREVAKTHDKEARLRVIKELGLLNFIFAVVAFVTFELLLPVMRVNEVTQRVGYIWGFGFFFIVFSFSWVFHGLEKMWKYGSFELLMTFIFLIGALLAIKGPEDLEKLAYIRNASIVISWLVVILLLKREFGADLYKDLDFTLLRSSFRHIKHILMFAAAFLFIQIYYNMDKIMLGYFKQESAVGQYQSAYKLVLGFIAFGNIISGSVMPIVSSSTDQNISQIVQRYLKIMILFIFPVIYFLMMGSDLIKFVYGSSYLDATAAYKILMATVLVIYVNIVFGNSILFKGRHKEYAKIVGVAAISNFFLNIILIPKFSINGAALATFIAELVVLFYSVIYFTKRISPISVDLKYIGKVSLVFILMLPILFITVFSGIVRLGLAVAGYAIIMASLYGKRVIYIMR